ncbi:MAG: hypothetical protein RBG13Loki_3554 [Promethearchaeota archaeon CR_4]|nr:MAG: hypothetical protein RBG13Loki_3554 [Candidatus Lokiarchaeota archaeon CR_4]
MGIYMARRIRFASYLFCFLCVGLLCYFPYARSASFSETVEIRHYQVVFYLVSLQEGELFHLNCSTYFNSTVHAFILTERPTEDLVHSNGTYKDELLWPIVNASDVGNKPNATVEILSNETKIFYIQLVQQADKSDYLLVDAWVSPDRLDFAITRYYIPFIAGFPILEVVLAVTAGLFVTRRIYRNKYKIKK